YVTLLEARNRLGGRIYTITASDGKTLIELGASYWEGLNTSIFYQHYLKNQTLRLDQGKSQVISIDRKPDSNNILENYYLAQKALFNSYLKYKGRSFAFFIKELHASYWVNRFLENTLAHNCTPLDKG